MQPLEAHGMQVMSIAATDWGLVLSASEVQ